MLKLLNIFFVTLGVIFFLFILGGIYFYVTDPLNLKPMFFDIDDAELTNSSEDASEIVEDKHPLLSPSQERALETIGIDPADVPSEISSEQDACFEATLGEERYAEIKAGDSPTAADVFKAKGCI